MLTKDLWGFQEGHLQSVLVTLCGWGGAEGLSSLAWEGNLGSFLCSMFGLLFFFFFYSIVDSHFEDGLYYQ